MSIRFLSIIMAIFVLPFLIIMGLGGYWLWQHEWLYQAVGVLSANSVLIYALLRQRSQKIKFEKTKPSIISPNPNWTDDGEKAWQALEAITERWKSEPDLLTNSNKVVRLTNDVLITVAQNFHEDSNYPIL